MLSLLRSKIIVPGTYFTQYQVCWYRKCQILFQRLSLTGAVREGFSSCKLGLAMPGYQSRTDLVWL